MKKPALIAITEVQLPTKYVTSQKKENMKGKLKTIRLISVIVLSLLFSGVGVHAQDIPDDSGCL